ncbi:MAG: PD-(D/E)XK nuclease family protein [Bacteroidota bacterium]|nr:PD-(D/E)XK nuclease family protein [Bacteroidota bacterium]
MEKFLEKTAGYLVEHYGNNLEKVCIVLPNRRAGLYLKKYLGERLSATTWAPGILSIEDFMSRLSGLSICDPLQVLFELFLVHREIEGENAQSFEEFAQWGQQLISDFREIDEYLIDPDELFLYLDETKALTVWNLNTRPLTDFEKNYLRFFHSLGIYYKKLAAILLNSGKAYSGLIFRKTAENIEKLSAGLPWDKVIFAGFNALTKAEETVMDYLSDHEKSEFLWDSDPYYRDDEKQEAGFFLRKWAKKWKNVPFRWNEDHFREGSKEVKVTGVPLNVGQAKLCSEILEEIIKEGGFPENTAVVMMDEQMLFPVLNSLTSNIRELNITMGMPLKQTPLFSLIDSLFRMQENARRFSSNPDSPSFYFKDVIFLLNHPFLKRLSEKVLEGNPFVLEEQVRNITRSGIIFLSREQITGARDELFTVRLDFLDIFFQYWKDPEDALRCLKQIIVLFRDNLLQHKNGDAAEYDKVEMEILYSFSKLISQISVWIRRFDAITNVTGFARLFSQLAGSVSIPFYGEPLCGIQMMGMLETRTLDFDQVILLSANEDLLPGGKSVQSFIPYEIKRDFGLPTWHHKNSIYAYHFYRLLQHSKKTYILYNTEPDELGGGEKSRFIKQISNELRGFNPEIRISESLLATPPSGQAGILSEKIVKSPEILAMIEEKARQGFAPTALNNYIRCPLKFYLNNIAGLKEEKEAEETIDVAVLGQAIHKALEILHRKRTGIPLTGADADEMIKESAVAVDEAFKKLYKGPDVRYGKNLLIVRVAYIMVKRYLESEKKEIENLKGKHQSLIVKHLELPVESFILVPVGNESKKVKLKGFIDRIDQFGLQWRIIDYKSGTVNNAGLSFKSWEDLLEDDAKSKCIQLLMYALMVLENSHSKDIIPGVFPGIVSLKKISSGFMGLKIPDGEENTPLTSQTLDEFRKILISLLSEIFDPSLPFSATENINRCRYCEFISFCGR